MVAPATNTYLCGTTAAYIASKGSAAGPSNPNALQASAFPSSAIYTCLNGKVAFYMEDLVSGNPHAGFSNSTTGTTRSATLCAVMSYIGSVIDFSHVTTANPIRIHVIQSYETGITAAPTTTGYLAKAAPAFNQNVSGITSGYVNEYITQGTFHTDVDGYQAELQVNWDKVYDASGNPTTVNFYDGTGAIGKCQYDLYSTLLHEITHALGWVSMITNNSNNNSTTNNLQPLPLVTTANIFSALDYHMTAGSSLSSLVPVISGTTSNPTINSSAPWIDNNYWVNGQDAPFNHPLFAGYEMSGLVAATPPPIINTGSYLSHLDEQPGSFTRRQRISPGESQEYVMAPGSSKGVTRRFYTKGELQTLANSLGYTLIGSNVNTTLNNHPPYSTKMATDPYTVTQFNGFAEKIPADKTITNTGAGVTITLANEVSLVDADHDAIYAVESTVVNFRGCGSATGSNGGNNHDQLTYTRNSTNDITGFTYTPRPGFWGRAQFGFRLTDNKEQGSYVVYTIDVAKNPSATVTPGNELMMNGNFEDGSEVRRLVLNDELKFNTTEDEQDQHEGRLNGAFFSDGAPYDYMSNAVIPMGGGGPVIRNAIVDCSASLALTQGYGNRYNPNNTYNSLYNAFTGATGQRYQLFTNPVDNCFSFYNLLDKLQSCHVYTLTFQIAYPTVTGGGVATNGSIAVKFTDKASLDAQSPTLDFYNPGSVNFNYSLPQNISVVPSSSWQTVSVPIYYCGNNPSDLMFLQGTAGAPFVIDNISLTENLNPPALTVSIQQIATANGCTQKVLSAVTANMFPCNPTYSWTLNGQVIGTTEHITVPSALTGPLTVTVNDGCRTATNTISLTNSGLQVAIAKQDPCGPTTLTVSPNYAGCTYSWTGPGVPSGSGNYGVISANPGNYTVTVTDQQSGCTGTASVTVNSSGYCCVSSGITGNPSTIYLYNSSSSYLYNTLLNLPVNTPIQTSNYIVIDGTFTVDANLSITGTPNIILTPNAKIVVNTGKTLSLQDQTKLRAACGQMWDGIYASGAAAVNIQGCEFHDMMNGVNIASGALLTCSGNSFIDNFYGLFITNAPAGYNPAITKNTFANGTGMLPPYAGGKARYGIYALDCKSLLIGHNTDYTNGNNFTNLQTGIYVTSATTNSNVTIANNSFSGITGGSWGMLTSPYGGNFADLFRDQVGTAIMGYNNTGYTGTIKVTSTVSSQKITGCTKAITVYGYATTVTNETIENGNWGITLGRNAASVHTVTGNTMNNVYDNIDLKDLPASGTAITSNVINTVSVYGQFYNYSGLGNPSGINISSITPSSTGTITVNSNEITIPAFAGTGINLVNTGSSVLVQKNKIFLTTTQANLTGGPNPGTSVTVLSGISLMNCNGSVLQGNKIKGTNATLNNSRTNVACVYLGGNNHNVLLTCNHDTSMKYGFLVIGDNTNTNNNTQTVRDNDFYNHVNGMLFRSLGGTGSLGTIGSTSYDCRNVFNGVYATQPGNGAYSKIYRLSSTCNTPTPDKFFTTVPSLTTFEFDGNMSSCNYQLQGNQGATIPPTCTFLNLARVVDPDTVKDPLLAELIARNEMDWSEYPDGTQWMEAKLLFDELDKSPDVRAAYPVLDSFYLAVKANGLGDITTSDDLIAQVTDETVQADQTSFTEWYNNAQNAVNQLDPNQDIQTANEQIVDNVFLNYTKGGLEVLTDGDYNNVETLAFQCPLVGGPAVYKARMLYGLYNPAMTWDDIDVCNNAGVYKGGPGGIFDAQNAILAGQTVTLLDNKLTLYPNPTNGQLTVKYQLQATDKGILEITDVFGKLLMRTTLRSDRQQQTVEMNDMPSAVYYYRYLVNDVPHDNGKIVLTK